ncbi:hypothetical protein [Hymenobacter aerophilus]|uniref:hypothetical protein n=1 Tax=Hymenobacter aerophilus TaxID=119644 RepID=UPI0012FAD708|nr:hypothetical protein [Hymenobacter aerophilus]
MRISSLSCLLLAAGVASATLSSCDSTRQVASTESSSSPLPSTPAIDEGDVTFNQEVTQGEYRFQVKTFGSDASRVMSIRSYRGSSLTTDPIRTSVTGAVTSVMAADMNGNGKPELYVMTDNKKANGGLYGFEFTDRGYAPISMPGAPAGAAGTGYMGQDTYQISGNKLIRTFPITPADGTPSTGNRTVEYTLDSNGKLVMGQSMDR